MIKKADNMYNMAFIRPQRSKATENILRKSIHSISTYSLDRMFVILSILCDRFCSLLRLQLSRATVVS